MNRIKKIGAVGATIAAAVLLSASSCSSSEYDAREKIQEQKKSAVNTSLDKKNLERKDKIESNASQVGYVYIATFGEFVRYFVINGKVSSSGGQLTPEQDIVCRYSSDSCQAVDGPFDDGTYGEREPGIFFFTTDGAFVHTSMDYFYSSVPLKLDVPQLAG